MAYALTSRGDLKSKLDYAFELYDSDNNGSLTTAEIKPILHAMLDLLVCFFVFMFFKGNWIFINNYLIKFRELIEKAMMRMR